MTTLDTEVLVIGSGAGGSVTAATLAAATRVVADGTGMDFIANATGAILAESWTPALQELAAHEVEPEELLRQVQADYTAQIGR